MENKEHAPPEYKPLASRDDDENQDQRAVNWLPLVAMGMVQLAGAIDYGLIMPSLHMYIQNIEGHSDTYTYGLILACFSTTTMLSKPFVGTWCDCRSFREVYTITILLAIIGNTIYGLARHYESITMVFVGRLLSGMGASTNPLLYAYIALVVPPERRSRVMMVSGMSFPVGMALGPCTNFLTAAADFEIAGVYVDEANAPGFLIAIVLAILLVAILFLVKEPPKAPRGEESSDSDANSSPAPPCTVGTFPGILCSCNIHQRFRFLTEVWQELKKPAVAMCFLVLFDFNMFIAASESVVVPVTQYAPNLMFSPLQNSFVYAGVALQILCLTIVIMSLSKRYCIPDDWLVLVGLVTYCAGTSAVLLLWDYSMPLWKFLVGEAALITAIPFAFAPTRALFSKAVQGVRHQGLLSSLLSAVSSLGSIAGPLWMGRTTGKPQESGPVAQAMFIGLLILSSLSTCLILYTWFGFYPPIHKSKNNNSGHLVQSKEEIFAVEDGSSDLRTNLLMVPEDGG